MRCAAIGLSSVVGVRAVGHEPARPTTTRAARGAPARARRSRRAATAAASAQADRERRPLRRIASTTPASATTRTEIAAQIDKGRLLGELLTRDATHRLDVRHDHGGRAPRALLRSVAQRTDLDTNAARRPARRARRRAAASARQRARRAADCTRAARSSLAAEAPSRCASNVDNQTTTTTTEPDARQTK